MQQGGTTRSTQFSVSAALAAANAALQAGQANLLSYASETGSSNGGGHSLADMAQRDLDAALQLLADRAQYITGANGAAIALRRDGKKDMLCRASTGSNVPELGALLSTEFGLSGESVRTRRALRCDNTEHDKRVNQDVCRQMGIASVIVMPVVNDNEVLGVFELFSGRANAFGERDITTLRRLSGMVEAAVRLATASQSLSERLAAGEEIASAAIARPADGQDAQDDGAVLEVEQKADPETLTAAEAVEPQISVSSSADIPTAELADTEPATAQPKMKEAASASAATSKPLFWSAALTRNADTQPEADQSHVPPMLRNLRKCQACGFPVSSERTFCVDCEEKKWRGQLRGKPAVKSGTEPTQLPAPSAGVGRSSGSEGVPIAPAAATPVEAPQPHVNSATPEQNENAALSVSVIKESAERRQAEAAGPAESETKLAAPEPSFLLSGVLGQRESWLSANKYILGAIVIVAAVVGTILVLR